MTIRVERIPHDVGFRDIDFNDFRQSGSVHTFQFTVRNSDGQVSVPTAGTVTATIRTPGAREFEDVPNNEFALNSRSNWVQPLIGVHIESVRLSLSDLDSGSTLDVAISSSFGGG